MARVCAGTARSQPWWVVNGLRVCAWGALVAATGLLVRAEVRRSELPAGVTAETDIVYRRTSERRLRLDVYQPVEQGTRLAESRPVILAIHGGGWTGGSKISFGQMVARLAQHGYVVVSVDYTLCRPGRPSWPASLDDVRAALGWLRGHAREYRIDPDRVIALGASAGGHLAALLGTTAGAGEPGLTVRAVVDFYGPSDLGLLAAQNRDAARIIAQFLGAEAAERPELYEAASPSRRVNASTPPMLLFHGADDSHVPPAQSKALADALRAAGVRERLVMIPGARHGFGLRLDEQRDLVPEILAFLEPIVRGPAGGQPPSGDPALPR